MKKLLSLLVCFTSAMCMWAGTNLFDASQASVNSTWGANDVNPTATWENSTLSITLNAAQPGWQWGNQVKFNHNVAFDAAKSYKVTYTMKADADCGGVTFKMDDNNGMIYENQTINLTANTDYNYEKIVTGVAGGNKLIVWDFGYGAQNTHITISNITVEEVITYPQITASSADLAAINGADGNESTRWASASSDPQWWMIDYGEAHSFNAVKIIWEGAYSKDFKIQGSNDGETFTDLKTVTDQNLSGFPNTQVYDMGQSYSYRYIRFYSTARGTQWGNSFWEFDPYVAQTSVLTTFDFTAAASVCKVDGTVALTATPKDQYGVAMAETVSYEVSPATAGHVENGVYTADAYGSATITATCGSLSKQVSVFNYQGDNVALNKTVTGESIVNAATRVNDGNDGTEYQVDPNNGTSSQDVTGSFTIDFGKAYDLNLVTIHFEGACSDAYTIQTSADGETWNQSYSYTGSNGINNHTDYIYGENLANNTSVRYIKFTSTKNATGYGMKIFEFQVFGTDVPDTRAASDLTLTSDANVSIDLAAATKTSQISYTSSSTGAMTFASSKESVATVSDAGLITAVGVGEADITLTQAATDAMLEGTQTVHVTVTNSAAVPMNFGSAGHFGTPDNKKVFYQFFYADGKLTVKLNSLTGSPLDFAELQTTTKGNMAMDKEGNGYTKTLDVTAGDDLYMRFLYSDETMGGNEMTAEGLSATDAHIIYWKATPVAMPATIKDTNFALASNGSSATATSGTAADAIDGNNDSRWESAQSDPQDFVLNMGQRRLFNTVQIRWEGAYTKTFDLMLSDDGTNWATVKSISGQSLSGFPNEQSIDLGIDVAAQYIKFHSTERGTQWGNSFYEFRVLYPANSVLTTFKATPASTIVKLGATDAITLTIQDQNGKAMDAAVTYTVSPMDAGSITNGVYTPAKMGLATISAKAVADGVEVNAADFTIYAYDGDNLALSTNIETDNKIIAQSDYSPNGTNAFYAVDGNDDSVWQGSPQNGDVNGSHVYDSWFVVDLGGKYDLNLVTIHFEGACSKSYHVDASLDNAAWTSIATGGSGQQNYTAYHDMSAAKGVRYVRFWSTEAATGWGMKVFEFQAFGTPNTAADVAVTGVSLNKTATSIVEGNTETLTATVTPDDATNKGVIWSSSNEAAATVSDAGVVTAVAPGEATITAKTSDGNFTATCMVTVTADLSKPQEGSPAVATDGVEIRAIYSDDVEVAIAHSFGFNPWGGAAASTGVVAGDNYLFFNTADNTGATIGNNGNDANTIIAKSGMSDPNNADNVGLYAVGMTHLHLDVWSKAAANDFRVLLNDYQLPAQAITGAGWQSIDIDLTSVTEDNLKNIRWMKFNNMPSATKVAIDNVYFWKSNGTAAVESVALNKSAFTLDAGLTETLTATVAPAAANQNVVWSTSDAAVATVADGVVTAVAAGTATIRATSEADDTKYAECTVTVVAPTAKTYWGQATSGGTDFLYSVTYRTDGYIDFTAQISKEDGVANPTLSVVPDGEGWISMTATDGVFAGTSANTYTRGNGLHFFFYAVNNGASRLDVNDYVVGAESTKPTVAVAKVVLDQESADLMPGESVDLTATVYPTFADNKSITWTSDDASATVDQLGHVAAVSTGTAHITATADGKTASCEISVIGQLTPATYKGMKENNEIVVAYDITRNADRTVTYRIVLNTTKSIYKVSVVLNDVWNEAALQADGSYVYTTSNSNAPARKASAASKDGAVLNGFIYIETLNNAGVSRVDFNYTVGSTGSNYYSRTTTAGRYGTICLPKAAQMIGATVYSIAGKKMSGSVVTSLCLEEVEGNLTAGQPYIFLANAEEVDAIYSGDAVTEAGSHNGLIGSFVDMAVAEGNYLISRNKVLECGTGCSILANRAYIDMSQVSEYSAGAATRIIILPIGTDGIQTGLDQLSAEGQNQKFLLNGKLMIRHNGQLFNAAGQLVK